MTGRSASSHLGTVRTSEIVASLSRALDMTEGLPAGHAARTCYLALRVADRMGVMGWSYGGYMTSTIITKTNRFKFASTGAPVTDLWSFYYTADIPEFIESYFGMPWDDFDMLKTHSAPGPSSRGTPSESPITVASRPKSNT